MKTKAYETYTLQEFDEALPYQIGDLVEVVFVSQTGLGDNEPNWLKVVRKNVGKAEAIDAEFEFGPKCVKAVKAAK
ncbi:hypothetical protein [Fructilactobacillus frigidiflavus]|uniref:hypothetical protein n=1 Tax=Fructilactobacillus frigidiflavus TaxID=3242688 RepID=UPI003757C2B7